MTREEILALPAGPELDALVAKFVMDFKEINPQASEPYWVRPDGRCQFMAEFRPSMDIAAAWEVAEKLARRNQVSVGYSPILKEWAANFTDDDEDSQWADTAPLAICRAALLAVMG